MSWRTDEREVGEIIAVDNDINVAPFIDTANALVDQLAAHDEDSVVSTALLKEIERYLAAHFYSHRDQLEAEAKSADASAVFQGKTDMGLNSTQYGQTAQDLDVSGYLRSLKGARARIAWLGLVPSDQTDYKDRD